MNKLFLTLITLLLANAALASEAPVSGTSRLKLEDSVRATRKAIEDIDKKIAKLDKEIAQEQGLAATYKALPNDGLRSSQFQTLAGAGQLERDQLLKERAALQESLKQ